MNIVDEFDQLLGELEEYEQPGRPKYDKKSYLENVKKLIKHVNSGNRILVYGDYDVDGILSVLIFQKYVEAVHKKIYKRDPSPLVHRRFSDRNEGFGMTEKLYGELSKKYDLIVLVDTGSELPFLKRGMDNLLILDHHPAERSFDFVVNPNIGNEVAYLTSGGKIVYDFVLNADRAYRQMVGKGVLEGTLEKVLKEFRAVTLVSDMAVMDKNNRKLVREALDTICVEPVLPVYYSSIENLNNPTTTDLSFSLISRVNGFSRMGENIEEVVEWILPSSLRDWERIDKKIDIVHKRKMAAVRSLLSSLPSDFFEKALESGHAFVFLEDNDLHGLNGLLANKIFQFLRVPSFVVSRIKDGEFVGSARGYGAKSMLSYAFSKIGSKEFGGHEEACGFRLKRNEVALFEKALAEAVSIYANDEIDSILVSDEPVSVEEFLRMQELYAERAKGVDFYKRPVAAVHSFKTEFVKRYASGYASVCVKSLESGKTMTFFVDASITDPDSLEGKILLMSFSPKTASFTASLTKEELRKLAKRMRIVVKNEKTPHGKGVRNGFGL